MKLLFFLPLIPFIVFSQISDRPNVVLFMADDMGMGDTSAYQFYTKNSDDQQIHTPAMEKLASMGMLFTDAHINRFTPQPWKSLQVWACSLPMPTPHHPDAPPHDTDY